MKYPFTHAHTHWRVSVAITFCKVFAETCHHTDSGKNNARLATCGTNIVHISQSTKYLAPNNFVFQK